MEVLIMNLFKGIFPSFPVVFLMVFRAMDLQALIVVYFISMEGMQGWLLWERLHPALQKAFPLMHGLAVHHRSRPWTTIATTMGVIPNAHHVQECPCGGFRSP